MTINVASGGSGGSADALGSFANPVTDPAAARPTGLTRVVWRVPGPDAPANAVAGDIVQVTA